MHTLQRKIITTADGSKTIYIEDWNEHYHSKHGAIQEAYHVFIKHGLRHFCNSNPKTSKKEPTAILEIGFGTGLNTFITLLETEKLNLNINYVGVEAFPVSKEEIALLNYAQLISEENSEIFKKLHTIPWDISKEITSHFKLKKQLKLFSEINDLSGYDIIYFDAFAARVQPELWTASVFKIMYKALKPKGILVTYSAKGSVRRAMQTVGFTVERLEGPLGKREMLRATK